ncbi:hypothetical protein B7495_06170 [Cryobacterium sp. LW097]|nr:hypothetical protein B7495_06170 [Cryobacterium sp. LW097]
MMLRKYFSGYYKDQRQGDPLNLNAVIRALRESIVDPEISDETWQGMEENVKRLESHTRYRINGVDKPELKIVEDELYGRYLHGEAHRWRHQVVSRHGVDSALWSMTHNRANRVQSVELLVRVKIENGLLRFED